MKILCSGSSGFVGYHTCKKLLQLGYDVAGVDNCNNYYSPELKEARNKELLKYHRYNDYKVDISNYKMIHWAFDLERPDIVVNLAAQAGVRRSLTEPHIYERSNILGFLNILELCRKFKIQKLVYASSSSVYGNSKEKLFSECDRTDTPKSLYAVTKKTNELMAYSYSQLYNLDSIGLRFFSVYGPWGRPDMALWQFTERILKNIPIDVYNNGNMCRDWTYIDDIVDGIILSIFTEMYEGAEIFNLGNNTSEPLMKMIDIVEAELGKKAIKNMLPMQKGDVSNSLADIQKAKELLNYEPKFNIEQGIPLFIKWYKDYFNNI